MKSNMRASEVENPFQTLKENRNKFQMNKQSIGDSTVNTQANINAVEALFGKIDDMDLAVKNIEKRSKLQDKSKSKNRSGNKWKEV